jgi:hypothetical protein
MLRQVAWTALLAGVLLLAGITIGAIAYATEDQDLALLAIVITLGSIAPAVLSYRET